MKNRKREETTKKTKRQTSEAKKSESEKGSCGSRGETKQKRSRNGGDEKAKRSGRSEPGGFREEVQREGMERRYGEKVWREGMERRGRAEIRRGGVEVRFEGQGMQKGDAEAGSEGEEPGGASPCAARSPPATTLRTTETHSSGNRARAHSRYEPPRPARSCP